jgi:hypothetical protein
MPPAASSSELASGVALLASSGSGLMNKFLLYRIMVALSTMWVQLLSQQVAYGYMGCGAMCNLGTNFLVA